LLGAGWFRCSGRAPQLEERGRTHNRPRPPRARSPARPRDARCAPAERFDRGAGGALPLQREPRRAPAEGTPLRKGWSNRPKRSDRSNARRAVLTTPPPPRARAPGQEACLASLVGILVRLAAARPGSATDPSPEQQAGGLGTQGQPHGAGGGGGAHLLVLIRAAAALNCVVQAPCHCAHDLHSRMSEASPVDTRTRCGLHRSTVGRRVG